MSYKISELPVARERFGAVFGLSLGEYTDTFMTAVSQRIVIDIVKLGDKLESMHPDKADLSLSEIVFRVYDSDAVELLKKLS